MVAEASDAKQSRDRALRTVLRVSAGLLSVAAILFFVDAFRDLDFSKIEQWKVRIDWPIATLSLAIGVGHVAAACHMILLLLPCGERPGMLAILLMSQVAKYVPGKIWGVVMQKALMSSSIGTVRLASANLVGMALVVLAQLAVLMAALCWRWAGPMFAVIAVSVVAAALHGSLLLIVRFAGAIPRLAWLSQQEPRWCLRLTSSWLLTTVTLIFAWTTFFSGALRLDEQLSLDSLVLTTASFVVGLASILPAGIGVREGAFLLLGERIGVASAGVVIGLAVLTRVYLLVLDALASLSGWALHVFRRCAR